MLEESELEREIIELESKYIANTYNKREVVFVRGRGVYLWDVKGRRYIDCVAGHGSVLIGHCHPRVVEAIKKQVERLIACPGIYYNDVRAKLVKKIEEITPRRLEVSFLSNSGTEAVECAIKLARLHTGKHKIIAMKRGFHGRTIGSLSLTWKPKYREPFKPLMPGVIHVAFGKSSEVRDAIDDDTAAVIVEPVQGEGGVHVAPNGYLRELREICDEKGVLLIFDEVQTGFGRTGEMFACQHWNVEPDVMCLAKAAANGVPIGITVGRREVMDSFKPGLHGTTFGGNPLAASAALATINVIVGERLYERARVNGEYFKNRLIELSERIDLVREVRGLGLMLAVSFKKPIAQEVILRALRQGVLLLPTGSTTVRLLPPLIIERGEVDFVVEALERVLEEIQR